MLLRWENRYVSLLLELNEAVSHQPTGQLYAESGQRIASQYWALLKDEYKMLASTDVASEINFFRNIKPRFTCLIEYYRLLSQAFLCLPASSQKQALYWKEELGRFHRFQQQYNSFIEYYYSDRRHLDEKYFCTHTTHRRITAPERIYNDADCRSSHDHLVRRILAFSLYQQFVCRRLAAS